MIAPATIASTDLPSRISRSGLLERFIRYVQIDTTADPKSSTYPSSAGQSSLTRMLADELTAMGAVAVRCDENGLTYATIPATAGLDQAPVVALVAHVDTSPEAPGVNVRTRVIDDYDGGVIQLGGGITLSPTDDANLATLRGCQLVVTDGTTLLGGDDKAGVAILMQLTKTLLQHPNLPHGPVRIVMTCDEEIGHGTDHIDVAALDATVAYTIDGGGCGVVDVETFSADAMSVTFTGYNIHPAIATGRMINSIRMAADFIGLLPRTDRTPETTRDREGFIHVHDVRGGVGQTTVELILRSFDAAELDVFADLTVQLANQAVEAGGGRVRCDRTRQYRNLGDGLGELPEAIQLATAAFEALNHPSTQTIIRGGTDGSQLTEKGLPCPNLSSGQHNIHSVLEYACVDEMLLAGEHLIELLGLWSKRRMPNDRAGSSAASSVA